MMASKRENGQEIPKRAGCDDARGREASNKGKDVSELIREGVDWKVHLATLPVAGWEGAGFKRGLLYVRYGSSWLRAGQTIVVRGGRVAALENIGCSRWWQIR